MLEANGGGVTGGLRWWCAGDVALLSCMHTKAAAHVGSFHRAEQQWEPQSFWVQVVST